MDNIEEYIVHLVYGNEIAAIWVLISIAAIWGCLLGVTGVLAVQEHLTNRRNGKDQSR